MPFDAPSNQIAVVMSDEKKRLLEAAKYFDERGDRQYRTPLNVEDNLAKLQATLNNSNDVYQALENALWETGTKVGATVGDLMAAYGADQSQFNTIACFCQNGDTITGTRLAANLRQIAVTKT